MTQKKFDLEERFVDLAASIASFCQDLSNVLQVNITEINCFALLVVRL